MSKVIDYAWSGPSAAQIKALGFEGVMRYLSHDGSKNLSPAERDSLRAQGLSIGLVWESTANRAAQGYSAGTADASAANAQADALGYPSTCALYAAVDFDADPTHVNAYFGGWMAQSARPVGVYGSYRVVEALLPAVPFGWQTVAWSGGRVSTKAHLLQNGFSGSYDTNLVLKANYGQWTTTPPVPPQEEDVASESKFVTPYPPRQDHIFLVTDEGTKTWLKSVPEKDALVNLGVIKDKKVYDFPPAVLREIDDTPGTKPSPPFQG